MTKSCSVLNDLSRWLPLRLASSRARFWSPLALIAGALGIYVLFAIGYQPFVGPAVNTAVAQEVVRQSAAAAQIPSEKTAAVEQTKHQRRERSARDYRTPGPFTPWTFSGFRPWFWR
jgi:hypothetical protein